MSQANNEASRSLESSSDEWASSSSSDAIAHGVRPSENQKALKDAFNDNIVGRRIKVMRWFHDRLDDIDAQGESDGIDDRDGEPSNSHGAVSRMKDAGKKLAGLFQKGIQKLSSTKHDLVA
eukprot:CAMPEP_0113667422 /NCGR_PEP_ID=MMETSP0038_2-20120614/3427_1 /TAXON_ID=2898 /ORGANISM="Cryptomonas paramecium" /LENGTH=120 /DNA_ID=CAMNT_0000583035 /DNA_START=21 /DNA_END=383 /DNA_ORIENTATION=+ /assembly_acc=CAM_ASM_000170